MAVEAATESIQHRLAVGLSMAFLTIGHIAMGFSMAIGALQSGVFLVRINQPRSDAFVTSGA